MLRPARFRLSRCACVKASERPGMPRGSFRPSALEKMELLVSDVCEADFSCWEGTERYGFSLYPAAVVFRPGTRRHRVAVCRDLAPRGWGWGGGGRRATCPLRGTRPPAGHPSVHFPPEKPLKGSEPPALAIYADEALMH